VGPIAEREPLGRLLALALSAVIEELHERLEAAGWPRVRPLWGFTLLALRHQPRNIGAVGDLLGVTKQAAAKVVSSLEAAGLVERREDPTDRRATTLELTSAGARFLADAEAAYAAIEAGWASAAGAQDVTALRRTLVAGIEARYGPGSPPLRPAL
jgi:DNA-binding MarR family transcriptional regulator